MVLSEGEWHTILILKKVTLVLCGEQIRGRGIISVRRSVNKLLQKTKQEVRVFKTTIVMG